MTDQMFSGYKKTGRLTNLLNLTLDILLRGITRRKKIGSRETYFIALHTDGRTDKAYFRVASLQKKTLSSAKTVQL